MEPLVSVVEPKVVGSEKIYLHGPLLVLSVDSYHN